MGYIPDATLQAFRGSYNLGVFFRLGLTPQPILLSLSAQSIPIAMPNLDAAGSVYTGLGRIGTMPALETLINGTASTVSFALGGLDPRALGLMLDQNPEVLGTPVSIGIAPMDVRWQPAAPVALLWSGVADFVAESMPATSDPTVNRVQTLTLTALSGDQARQLGNNLTLTDATQQMLYPGDTACSRVSRYVATYIVSWPRFS
jgi:hypothetical protein